MFFIRKLVGKLTWKEEKNKYCNSPTLSILLLKYFCIMSQGMVPQVHKDVNEHYKLPTLDTGKSTRLFFFHLVKAFEVFKHSREILVLS